MKTGLSGIANHYAQAVLELAAAEGQKLEQAVLADLESINKEISSQPEFTIIFNHPAVSSQQKKKLFRQLFAGQIQELTLRLLELLTDKRRLELLPYLESEYRSLLLDKENILSVTLTSAQPLTEAEVNTFETKLTQQLGKKLRLKIKVDPRLIGGLIIRVGDQVIDGSLSGKLRVLEKQLLAV